MIAFVRDDERPVAVAAPVNVAGERHQLAVLVRLVVARDRHIQPAEAYVPALVLIVGLDIALEAFLTLHPQAESSVLRAQCPAYLSSIAGSARFLLARDSSSFASAARPVFRSKSA